MLILADNNGIPIALSEPIAGNHNDSFELVANFENMISPLRNSNIRLDGLFLNADAVLTQLNLENIAIKTILSTISNTIKEMERMTLHSLMMYFIKTIRNRKNQCLVKWV